MPNPLFTSTSSQGEDIIEDEIDFGDDDLNFGDEEEGLEVIDLECGDQSSSNSSNTIQNKSQEQITPAPASSLRFWPLRIKSNRDVLIRVRPIDTIGAVKQEVLQALGEDGNDGRKKKDKNYVRLVCKGRLLAPDNAALKDLKFVQPNDVVHAVLTTSQQQRPGVQAAIQQGNLHHLSRRALRSAGINANGMAVRRTADEQEQDDDSSSSGDEHSIESGAMRSSRRRRGFDRLRLAGLSRGEISAIRAYFSRHVDRFIESNPRIAEELQSTDALVQRRLQEEAWMYSQGPTSEFRLNLPSATLNNPASRLLFGSGGTGNSGSGGSADQADDSSNNPWVRELRITASRNGLSTNITTENGTSEWTRSNNGGQTSTNVGNDRDFLCGFMLGFFVGFLMLVWVWMPTVPHKQKLGILTGITVQLALNTLRPQSSEDDNLLDDIDGLHGIPNAYAKLGENMDDAVVLG